MPTPVRATLLTLLEGGQIDAAAAEAAIGEIMDGGADPIEIAALLTALRCRGETVDQLAGAARAMRARSKKIECRRTGMLDTCGTGGDSLHTFNISTATAFVAAASGVPVAKHGNRSASSKSGSADVLEALGAHINLSPEAVARCVDETGIGFCFAPLLHGAMKYAAPVRQKLGFRTLFNLLGPLTNPANAEYQLVGVGRVRLAEMMAHALSRLGGTRAFVVCGNDELDEVSLWGTTTVFEVRPNHVTCQEWEAADFGLPNCRVEELQVGDPAESAAMIRSVFNGTTGAPRNMVVANAAAALLVASRAASLREAADVAAETIDTGRAAALVETFVRQTAALSAS